MKKKPKREWVYVGPRQAAQHPWYSYDIAVWLVSLVVLLNLAYSISFIVYSHVPFQFGIDEFQLFRLWDDLLVLKADYLAVHLGLDYLAVIACLWALFLIADRSPNFVGGGEAILLVLVFVRSFEVILFDQASNEPYLHSLAWFLGFLAGFLVIVAVIANSPFVRVTFLKQVPKDWQPADS